MGGPFAGKPTSTNRKPATTAKAAQTPQNPQTIQWTYDLQQAYRLANESGKPMLIVVGGAWCPHCRKLEKEVLGNSTIARYVNTVFIPVHLDSEKDARAAQILEVRSLPTTVILSPEADLLGSIEGYVPPKEFTTVLKQSMQFQRARRQEQVALTKAK